MGLVFAWNGPNRRSLRAGASNGSLRMMSREELRRECACQPGAVAEYAFGLQEQLAARDQALAEKERMLAGQEQLLAEARGPSPSAFSNRRFHPIFKPALTGCPRLKWAVSSCSRFFHVFAGQIGQAC